MLTGQALQIVNQRFELRCIPAKRSEIENLRPARPVRFSRREFKATSVMSRPSHLAGSSPRQDANETFAGEFNHLTALECDGATAVNIALRPDGSLDPGSVTQLQAVGNWMNINSAGIYGSRAWVKYGEGTNVLPTGALGSAQANKTFTTSDFRYTVGADGFLYAYCMTVPAAGAQLTLPSLGTSDNNLAAPITSVQLLGSNATLTWSQTATDLNITCPASMPFQTSVCFKIGPASIVRPPTPTDVYAHSTTNGVALQWSSQLISATFAVKRATDPAGPFTSIASGLAGQTYTDTTAQAGNIYYYVVTATQGSAASPDSMVVPGILAGSSSWQGQDVGAVGKNGEFAKSGNRIVISGSGADIWGTADEFYYAFRKLNGNGSITARIRPSKTRRPGQRRAS